MYSGKNVAENGFQKSAYEGDHKEESLGDNCEGEVEGRTEVACWMYTGERQATRMRLTYLRAMLNQDVSFFDTDATGGEVVAAITSDTIVVQDAIGEKVHILDLTTSPSVEYLSFLFE
eukprot:Gb_13910 [translate_table: standard]